MDLEAAVMTTGQTGSDGEDLLNALAEAGITEEDAVARPVEGGVELKISGRTFFFRTEGVSSGSDRVSLHRDLTAALTREGWTTEMILDALTTWSREPEGREGFYRYRSEGMEIITGETLDTPFVEDLFLPGTTPPLFLLFDIDGTLLSSRGAGRRALQEALEGTFGTAGPIDTYSFSGKLDPVIIRELMTAAGLEEGRVEKDLQPCLRTYARLLKTYLPDRGVRVMPGVKELLMLLSRKENVHLALCTGNIPEGAGEKLACAGLDTFFPTGAFGSDGTMRDHLPPCAFRRLQRHALRRGLPGRTVVIGDAPVDITSAHSAGFHSVGVLTGFHEPEELQAERPTLLLESFADPGPFLSFLEGLP